MWAIQPVRVSGPSMVPTLRDGDLVVVLLGAPVRPGDVVLARFADLPDRYLLKRAVGRRPGGWELRSDNAAAGGDSRSHGAGQVLGRVVLRRPAGGWRFRRVRRAGRG